MAETETMDITQDYRDTDGTLYLAGPGRTVPATLARRIKSPIKPEGAGGEARGGSGVVITQAEGDEPNAGGTASTAARKRGSAATKTGRRGAAKKSSAKTSAT